MSEIRGYVLLLPCNKRNVDYMTKLVIFDLDGTLLNSLQDLATSTNYALQRHGYPTHELPAFRFFVGIVIYLLL